MPDVRVYLSLKHRVETLSDCNPSPDWSFSKYFVRHVTSEVSFICVENRLIDRLWPYQTPFSYAGWASSMAAHACIQDEFEEEMQSFLGGEDCPVFDNMYSYCQVRLSGLRLCYHLRQCFHCSRQRCTCHIQPDQPQSHRIPTA